jgi:hypothetical protein
MSHEFHATLPLESHINLLQIAEAMRQTRYAVEALRPGELLLRYPNTARCRDWPEDATITLSATGIMVAMHSGSRVEMQLLLTDLSAAVREDSGAELDFQEV